MRGVTALLGGVVGAALAAGGLETRQARRHPFFAGEQLLVLAHRGGRGRWPENTRFAFDRAAAIGVDGFELDVHATLDGTLVVLHDPTVDRTTSGRGPVRSYNLETLQSLDAGYHWSADHGRTFPFRGRGIRVPTLEEILDAFPDMPMVIEIKQRSPSIVEPLCALLRARDRANRTVVGSFDSDTLRAFRRHCPEVATSLGEEEVRTFYLLSRAGLSRFYQPAAEAFQIPEWEGRHHLVTPRFIRDAHRHGMDLHVWTVNERAQMKRLIHHGVDGLITDFPDRLLDLLGRDHVPLLDLHGAMTEPY